VIEDILGFERQQRILRYVVRTCDLIVTSFWGKTRFSRCQKNRVCGAATKHVAMEIKFLHKKMSVMTTTLRKNWKK